MSRLVKYSSYLFNLRCSSSLHIFLQSISPVFNDAFSLYFKEVISLSAPSEATKQLRTCLWSVLEQTIRSSMCESACPVLVVRLLLVHVPYPGQFALLSK